MYIYIHVRALLRWPTAGRNEIHRHTFYDCCMLFPSLSFFVKIWPSKGRIGKHKRSRKKKTRFCCLLIHRFLYILYAQPARRQPHLINKTVDYFIHSFIHSFIVLCACDYIFFGFCFHPFFFVVVIVVSYYRRKRYARNAHRAGRPHRICECLCVCVDA